MRGLDAHLDGRLPRVVLNLLVTAVVAYFLACAAAVLVVDPVLPVSASGNEVSVSLKNKISIPPLSYFSSIWSRNPFNAARPKRKAKPKPKPKQKSIDQLAIAKLNIRLLGTMYSDFVGLSRAVTLDGNKQKMVKVGDKLSGFVIDEIQRRAIVLRRGKDRQLLLIDNADKKIAAKSANSRSTVARKDLKAKFQDLDALSRDIQLAPATRGKQKGLWIRRLRQGSMFSKVGLRKDDVLLKLDGTPVAKGANPLALMRLLDQDRVVVDILRDGKPMQLVLIITG